jgi:succinate dehydrogenase / fumarate reductase, cytochrome b subunit
VRERPLSPHLSIYRMSRYSLLSSIANRLAGLALSAGLIVLAYWLTAAASGAQAYARALAVLASVPLKVIYALLILAFVYHLLAGIRHLIWDSGRWLERAQSRRSAHLLIGASIVLGIALVWWALAPGARS